MELKGYNAYEKDSIRVRLLRAPAPTEFRRKSLSDLAFDDLLWVSGEFRNRINVVKGLFGKTSFMMFDNLQNNVVRQLSWRVGRQGISEDTVQDQNEVDNVGCQNFCC